MTLIPRRLADAGHDVTVMSLHPQKETLCGVRYLPLASPINDLEADIVVFNRNCIDRPVAQFFKDRGAKIVWWLHDIVDPRYLVDDGFRLADKIVALSDYCRRSYADFYSIYDDRFVVIPNGVDKSVFHPSADEKIDRGLFITASAPVKGLYPLTFAWHNIRRHNPSAELHMYASQKLHEFENTAEQERLLRELEGAGAVVKDPIPQKELAAVMREATALLMPNSYPEICSNVLLQARACGLPVIASAIGSAEEFLEHGKTGLLTHTRPDDLFWWHKDFAELCVKVVKDGALRDRIARHAPVGVESWWDIGSRWGRMLADLYVKEPVAI